MDLSVLLSKFNPPNESIRGRSYNQSQQYGAGLQRRDSSASSVRSMIDDRVRRADEERGRSRPATPVEPPSPFRSSSPFEREYTDSRRRSVTRHSFDASEIDPRLWQTHHAWTLPSSVSIETDVQDDQFECGSVTLALQLNESYCNEHTVYPCGYCDQLLMGSSALSLHLLGDHQCAYCTNERPYKNWKALFRHLNKEHLCRDCARYMCKTALFSHAHTESEVCLSIETETEETANTVQGVDRKHHRATTRTPSFSPPYMRPNVRRTSVPELNGWSHRTRDESSSGEHLSLSGNGSYPTPELSTEPSESSQGAVSSTAPSSSSATSQAPADVFTDRTRGVSLPLDVNGQQAAKKHKKRRPSRAAQPSHVCGICGKPFARRTLRDNHLRTHTNERPSACSYDSCAKTFKQKNEQTRHEQTQHQEKRFVCGGSLESGKLWGCGKASRGLMVCWSIRRRPKRAGGACGSVLRDRIEWSELTIAVC